MAPTSRLFAPLVALALIGCGTMSPSVPFNADTHDYAMRAGHSTIVGQAFLRQVNGGIVYGAGNVVALLPLTPYVAELETLLLNPPPFTTITFDQRVAAYMRQTRADGAGVFRFSGLAPGRYLLETTIIWFAGTFSQQGGLIVGVADIPTDGDTVDIILTW